MLGRQRTRFFFDSFGNNSLGFSGRFLSNRIILCPMIGFSHLRSGIPQRFFLLMLIFVFSFSYLAAEEYTMSIWITSDIQGYLSGCDCPTGASAGLSAIHAFLDDCREDSFLLDAGGFREPDRSDPLLEHYLDLAASCIGYDVLIADSADLRDGGRALHKRAREVPLTLAAGYTNRRFLQSLPDENHAALLDSEKGKLAVVACNAGDSVLGFSVRELNEALEILADSDGLHRVLVYRGSLDGLKKAFSGVEPEATDMMNAVVLTGASAPGAMALSGGRTGFLEVGGRRIPWVSPAPRGNGIVRITFYDGSLPLIESFSFIRGKSPQSPDILALGEAYTKDLTSQALSNAAMERADETNSGNLIKAVYWYPFGCRECEDFLWDGIPKIERASGKIITVEEHDTGDPKDFDALRAEMDRRGVELRHIPVMFVGNEVLQGDDEIKEGLKAFSVGISHRRKKIGTESSNGFGAHWEPGAVFLAGLLDGVNPCAFSAMVFLVSALALAGRTKKVMLAIGLSYSCGIFITYSLIGAGLLGGLRRFAVSPGIRQGLEIALAAILVILAILSVIDGIRLSRGRSDLLLKLPGNLSARAHSIIRNNVRSGAAAGGSFFLGATVALIELGCTGQVYLPTIAWMIARGEGGRPWIWLAIYNVAFIIPLIMVFIVSYKGVSAVRMASVFKKRGAVVKYVTAALFTILAAVILAT